MKSKIKANWKEMWQQASQDAEKYLVQKKLYEGNYDEACEKLDKLREELSQAYREKSDLQYETQKQKSDLEDARKSITKLDSERKTLWRLLGQPLPEEPKNVFSKEYYGEFR